MQAILCLPTLTIPLAEGLHQSLAVHPQFLLYMCIHFLPVRTERETQISKRNAFYEVDFLLVQQLFQQCILFFECFHFQRNYIRGQIWQTFKKMQRNKKEN